MAVDPWSYASKTRSEHAEQVALFMWANMAMRFGLDAANDPLCYNVNGYANRAYPFVGNSMSELKWLHAIANHGAGFGRAAEGVKGGVSDILLPVPVDFGYRSSFPFPIKFTHNFPVSCGLYMELKRLDSVGKKAGTPSDKQLEFQADMREAGYQCEIVYGWEAARDCILKYLGR